MRSLDNRAGIALAGLLSLCFAAVVLFAAALTEGLPRPVSALLFVAGFAVLVPALWATREVSA